MTASGVGARRALYLDIHLVGSRLRREAAGGAGQASISGEVLALVRTTLEEREDRRVDARRAGDDIGHAVRGIDRRVLRARRSHPPGTEVRVRVELRDDDAV